MPQFKLYRGVRTPRECKVVVDSYDSETGDREVRALNPRRDIRDHSPGGFEWGYGGSGPAQLALALVADATGDAQRAQRIYQSFKATFVLTLGDSWEIKAKDLLLIVEDLEQEKAAAER